MGLVGFEQLVFHIPLVPVSLLVKDLQTTYNLLFRGFLVLLAVFLFPDERQAEVSDIDAV